MRRFAPLLLVAWFVLLLAVPAHAERRVALVIGNGAYPAGPLKNPVNDARDMAAALRGLGFEVIARENASLAQMEGAVSEFWGKLKKGGAGLFYFAGHGLQVNGRNYLVPVDAKLEAEQDAKYKCMDAGLVLGRMENAGNDLNIIILDACRNNPFARSWRSADVGLAKMDAPKGSLIAYATAPDSVAADGAGKNGLYTEQLLRAMRTPGQPVEQMFKRVRDEVMRATKDNQVPWESTSLRGDFYFAGGGKPGAAAQGIAQPATAQNAPEPGAQLALQQPPAPPPAALDPDLELVKSLNGARYFGQQNTSFALNNQQYYYNYDNELTINGSEMIWRNRVTGASPQIVELIHNGTGGYRHKAIGEWMEFGRMPIEGREAIYRRTGKDGIVDTVIFVISKDGNTVTDSSGPNVLTYYRR